MARLPISLTDGQKAEVETLAAVLTAEQVADYFGVARRTFYAMMERDAEIAARYKKGKARAVGAIAQGLIAKARGGNVAAMIFFLKTQAGWREAAQIEHLLPGARQEEADRSFSRFAAILDRQVARKAASALPRLEAADGTGPTARQGDDRGEFA